MICRRKYPYSLCSTTPKECKKVKVKDELIRELLVEEKYQKENKRRNNMKDKYYKNAINDIYGDLFDHVKRYKCVCCKDDGFFRVSKDNLCENCEDYVKNYKAELKEYKKVLSKIRNDPTMWRTPKNSGCDKYQGLPPLCRYIDSVLGGENNG